MSQSSAPASHQGPAIHAGILLIVFIGGSIGTALRYAFAQIPAAGAFHTGTLAANLLACLCYAGLGAFLTGSAWFGPGSRFGAHGATVREYANRGLGMGMCGGLSTMSTLALECFDAIRDGSAAAGIAYLLATFALGIACAALGAWLGTLLARGTRGTGTGDTADSSEEAHR